MHSSTNNTKSLTMARTGVRASARGFSLIELILVLIIIGLVSSIAAVSVGGAMGRAKVRATKATLSKIRTSIEEFQVSNNQFPLTIDELVQKKYLQEGKVADGWGNDLYYRVNESNDPAVRPFELISMGPDGRAQTEDDISVWTMNDKSVDEQAG